MKITLPRLMISATHKSAGKTTLSLGLLSQFREAGMKLGAFKKGPDYIDPMWLRRACGRECYNLDPFLMQEEGCIDSFVRNTSGCDAALIEGNHGLHDGMALDGSNSSAGLASGLNLPVLLVVDSRGMNRGAAAVVIGMQQMQPRVRIAGVVLNRTKSKRQEDKQRLAIEHHCGIPVLGAIRDEQAVAIKERHLGLTTVEETGEADRIIQDASELVAQTCDIDAIRSLFNEAPPLENLSIVAGRNPVEEKVRIGVFRDAAFCFYYPDNLQALRDQGASLVFIDSLHDRSLPELDGLYIGGGFPESFFSQLGDNKGLISDLRELVRGGIPLYAECGGLIYLCESAHYQGQKHKLAGVLPYEIGFNKRPLGYGYIDLESKRESRWFGKQARFKAHEFHYSKPIGQGSRGTYQFNVIRGYGINGKKDGILKRSVFASYAHLHALATPVWAKSFVGLAQEYSAHA